MRDDATIQSAVIDLDTISRKLTRASRSDNAMAYRLVTPGLFGDMRKVIQEVLLKAELFSGVVLLAGLVNLACLLVASRTWHQGEEVPACAGSTFARLAQQLAMENAILCSVAGSLETPFGVDCQGGSTKQDSVELKDVSFSSEYARISA